MAGDTKTQLSQRFRCTRALLTAVALIVGAASAQTTAFGQGLFQGTVRDSAGTPIPSASVSIEQNSTRIKITTKPDGSFTVTDVRAGTLNVHIEKSGYCTLVIDSLPLSKPEPLNLVLTKSESDGRNCSAQADGSNWKIELEDKPSFTIAGITDWSGAGGHGSDTTLPTSETLTRNTLTMKSTPSPEACPANKERELRAAVTENQNRFEANHQLGEFYLICERYAEAIPWLETASRIRPEEPENTFQLASAYQHAGDLGRARGEISKLPAWSDNADAHRLLGDIDELQNDPLAAVREYEHATRLDPSEQNYFAWGTELLLHRAMQPATEVLTRATKAHPESERLLAGLGAALYAGGAYDEAARRICTASDIHPGDEGPYVFLGTMQKSMHQPLPCALEKLERFAALEPDNALANYYYAVALWKRSRRVPDGADAKYIESLLQKAVAVNPKLADAHLQLGMLYSAQGSSDKAIAAYEKAIQSDPQLSEAHYELGLAYKRLGRDADARSEFQAYAKVQKSNTEAAERRRREVRQFVTALVDHPPTASPH